VPVGLLTLELHIAEAQSLKDKRQVLRSLKDRLRNQFNVAVAELDFEQPGGLTVTCQPGAGGFLGFGQRSAAAWALRAWEAF